MSRGDWQSGKACDKVFDGVDNNIKLRKTKCTAYYNEDCNMDFDVDNFEDGALYYLNQQANNKDVLGKKIIISYINFDLKTGDVIYIEPKLMEYRLFDWGFGKFIHLVSVETGQLQSPNHWDSIRVFVWGCEKQEEALVEYNRRVAEIIKLREEVMNKRTLKELKSLSKIYKTEIN